MIHKAVFRGAIGLATLLLAGAQGRAQSDNFDDADDAGWTRFEPLAGNGAGGTFTFPNGGYRIQAAASPSPGLLGPGRAAGVRTDVGYTQFTVSVDLVDWNSGLSQAMGPVARIRELGFGTSDGYGFLFYADGTVAINRFDNENAVVIASGSITPDTSADYRLVFSGFDSVLRGQVFKLPDVSTPLLTVSANDTAYGNGNSGLLVAALEGTSFSADATFDNFVATDGAFEYGTTPAVSFGGQMGGGSAPSLAFIDGDKVVMAANFGGNDLERDGVGFAAVSATGANPMTNVVEGYTITLSASGGSLNTATFGDALYGTFIWASVQTDMTVKLEGFDAERAYKVYYLAGDNRNLSFNMKLVLTASNDVASASATNSSFTWGGGSGYPNYAFLPVSVSGATTLSARMTKNAGSAGVAFSGIVIEDVSTEVAVAGGNERGSANITASTHQAAQFATDTNAYALTSVALQFDTALNTTSPISISLFGDNNGAPGSELVACTGPANPSAGTFVYGLASAYTLKSNTTYHLVASVPSGSGQYAWLYAASPGEVATVGAGVVELGRETSADAGSSWSEEGTGSSVFSFRAVGVVAPALKATGLSEGSFQLNVSGATGLSVIQASTDLMTWTSIATNATLADPYTFIDAGAASFERRFYRAVK